LIRKKERGYLIAYDEAFMGRRNFYLGMRQQPSRGYGIRVRMEFK